MHQLDAGDCDRRVMKLPEAEHHSDALLDAPMSCSIKLFKYFDERSFVPVGNNPSTSARTPHGETQRSHP
jgi:hypothetical protein